MRVLTLVLLAAFAFAPLPSTAATLVAPTVKPSLPPSGPAKFTVTFHGQTTSTIEVSSFSWGVGRGIGSPMGGSANREASAPSVSEITFTVKPDKGLMLACASGEHIKTAILTTSTHKIVLNDVLVSSCRSSGGDRPMETVSFTFQKIEWTY
jgi:type VI protein secretion system component Hcp